MLFQLDYYYVHHAYMCPIRTPPTYKCPHSRPCYFLSTNWPTVWVLSHCRASSHTAQFPLFSSEQPNAPSMAMRKIGVGTLVSVEQESTGHGRRRPSEGGIGFVVKRKKQRRMEDKNGETPVVELPNNQQHQPQPLEQGPPCLTSATAWMVACHKRSTRTGFVLECWAPPHASATVQGKFIHPY